MTADLALLVVAGVAAGLFGSMAGLASIASYPALLAVGLDPLEANVTNTVALFGLTVGSIVGSRPELRGQGRRVAGLAALSAVGGLLGAALLLSAPASTFERVVPGLVALGAVLILARDQIVAWTDRRRARSTRRARSWSPGWVVVLLLVGVYGGYFGAGVGVIALAVLAVRYRDRLAVVNATKNVYTGAANGVAALAYVILAPVDWPAVLALGLGATVGGVIGPALVRITPERPLRYAIGVAGLALAVHLALG
ncbi:sulfite exporter TauE/SafE family protein [Mumia zhuanghuii]|uniref:Probable membrane transporter protein n=2 Tax=Mumia TaxID=1546255 RepID=A0ABW1QHU8_9ACTN|nr:MULTISPECIES: sulfite exporter TauE/SafE family protein [Mumia]KAA1418272.1 sulfite exporter TauE/SafE family protein [Mumia zhuanghuii]